MIKLEVNLEKLRSEEAQLSNSEPLSDEVKVLQVDITFNDSIDNHQSEFNDQMSSYSGSCGSASTHLGI